jgi:hypothetical protein
MTRCAGIRNAGPLRLLRSDEPECMRGHVVVLDGLLDAWHVTRRALASGTIRGVMCMFADRSVKASGILLRVTAETQGITAYRET